LCHAKWREKESSSETKVAELQDNLFRVSLDLLIQQDDTLHLYYTEDGTINFKEESSVWLTVKGNPASQKVTFELPKDVYPTQFRMDFGINNKNEEIILNAVTFDYKGNKLMLSDSNIFKYFRPDESVTILDPLRRSIKRKDPKQKGGGSLFPHETILGPELLKLAQNK